MDGRGGIMGNSTETRSPGGPANPQLNFRLLDDVELVRFARRTFSDMKPGKGCYLSFSFCHFSHFLMAFSRSDSGPCTSKSRSFCPDMRTSWRRASYRTVTSLSASSAI